MKIIPVQNNSLFFGVKSKKPSKNRKDNIIHFEDYKYDREDEQIKKRAIQAAAVLAAIALATVTYTDYKTQHDMITAIEEDPEGYDLFLDDIGKEVEEKIDIFKSDYENLWSDSDTIQSVIQNNACKKEIEDFFTNPKNNPENIILFDGISIQDTFDELSSKDKNKVINNIVKIENAKDNTDEKRAKFLSAQDRFESEANKENLENLFTAYEKYYGSFDKLFKSVLINQ